MKKTTLALALAAFAGAAPFANAVEYNFTGELAVELTDAESSDDLDLDVTTTDLALEISEKFGDVEVEGFIAYELAENEDDALDRDGAGITVSGSFGSVYVGDDGSGAWVGGETDVMYNNSEAFYQDPTTNVIDYALPLDGPLSLNIFVDITGGEGDEEDVDAAGIYGAYSFGAFTALLGYTSITDDGAYGDPYTDDILDLALIFEADAIAAGLGYQSGELDVNSADTFEAGVTGDSISEYEIFSAFVTFTAGKVAITPYIEDLSADDVDGADNDVVALNVAYNFSDNFYLFLETASYDDDESDNSSLGLVLTF